MLTTRRNGFRVEKARSALLFRSSIFFGRSLIKVIPLLLNLELVEKAKGVLDRVRDHVM